MIRPKLSLRRPLAAVGAVVAGLAAAIAVAAPASAHHSVATPTAECQSDGTYKVTWKVQDFPAGNSTSYWFLVAQGSPAPVTGLVTDPTKGYAVSETATGTQTVPGDAKDASITIQVAWDDQGHTWSEAEPKTYHAPLGGDCQAQKPEPSATFKSDCTGKVMVHLTNSEKAKTEAELTVKATKFEKSYTLKPGESQDVEVPAGAGKITVTEKHGEDAVATYTWTKPEGCGEPSGAYQSTCDKLIFEVTNPKDGTTIEVTFTPNKGEVKKLTVAPGETKTVEFDAFEGLTVKPSAEGMDDTEPIAWEKPKDCDKPAPSPSGTGGPALPVTGAAAGGIAGGAAVLLALGGVLFFVARRRRIRFTA
ncbi:cell wall anchor protein [Plantactinospora siamensis]|uniref:Cell wall anchor protein n=1 Tax=Plantactinospora siamensis TaxID=555372 RepID=A0ABV6NT16_9ACTN